MQSWTVGQDHPDVLLHTLRGLDCVLKDRPIVCFDYFDTLVVRNVKPENTKILAAHSLSILLNRTISGSELYTIRQEIEKNICEQNAANGLDFEFEFSEFSLILFQEIKQRMANWTPSWGTEEFCHKMLALEVAVEQSVQQTCEPVVSVLRELKNDGYTTILVSDFYLPGPFFIHMLKRHQLHEQFDHIYVSADYLINKGSGRLYKKICEDLVCSPEQLVMVGDNIHADIKMAENQGMRTLHINNPGQHKKYALLQEKKAGKVSDLAFRFSSALVVKTPFALMGYSLWLFIYRLFTCLVQKNIRNVFFFSKEGEFIKVLFDNFQQQVFGQVVITGHYILVSRKATFLASLRSLGIEDFLRLFAHYRDISLRDFLLSLNFEESIARELCLELELDYEFRFSDLRNHEQFAVLINSTQFQQLYETRRCRQRENFICYLDSFGVDYQREGLVVVDVGWKGSIQDNLYHILDGQVRIDGYYIGSFHATELRDNNLKKGLLFENAPQTSQFFNIYNNNRSLFEMMLGASHGSADGYFLPEQYAALPHTADRVVAIRIQNDGQKLEVVVLDLPEERQIYKEVIRPIQQGFFKLCSALNREYLLAECTRPDDEWFARQHARMVFTPKKDEVDLFTQLYHLENFGIFEFTNFSAGPLPSLLERVKHLKNVVQHPGVLETGVWPPVILNRLGLGSLYLIDGMLRYWKEFKKNDLLG